MKGMKTCTVCERDFPLIIEDHYIARDLNQTGLASIVNSGEAQLYDVIDCPWCGSQYILQRRKRNAIDDITASMLNVKDMEKELDGDEEEKEENADG